MELNIKQGELNAGILANYPDQSGNKIRLREISFNNFLRHVQNVPFRATFAVLENYDAVLGTGQKKPINVKENMFNNIIKHNGFSKQSDVGPLSSEVNVESRSSDVSQQVDSVSDDNKNSLNNSDNNASTEIDRVVNRDNVAFDDISNARELIFNAKAEADKANADALKSEQELSKLSVEETEVQKKLQDAMSRQREIKRQISLALENQQTILLEAREKYNSVISEANRKKEENQNKIIQFQTRIDNTKKQISEIENDISEQQNVLNALRDFGNYDDYMRSMGTETSDVAEKKIA